MPPFRDPLILAIDQGTTNTKAIVLDAAGTVRARASVPMAISFPRPGWVEQDPVALWSGVKEVIDDCLAQIAPGQPAVIGISNQRETVLAWDRAGGQPLGPAVVWQCRRTAEFCQELRERGLEPRLRERTGLTADPLFSASKARWLLGHVAGNGAVPRDRVCLGTVDSWLLWNLTGGAVHATDVSNAARTQLLNLRTAAWDPEMLELFGVPTSALPEVRPSSGVVGTTTTVGRLAAGVPIAALIGDSHAALFGQRGFTPGFVKATYGTGSSLMTLLPAGEPRISERGLSSTVAWGREGGVTYALEGNISVTGAAAEWFGQFLGARAGENPAQAVAALAREAGGDTGGVYVVPAFVGLGAPHWDEAARGLICGLTRGSTPAHVARAVIESVAYQIHDVFAAMAADAGAPFVELLADGGATRNDDLMQFQADLLGVPVVRNASAEVSALGAGFLAGLGVGIWPGLDAIAALPRKSDRFEPRMEPARRDALLAGWRDAVARTASSPGRR